MLPRPIRQAPMADAQKEDGLRRPTPEIEENMVRFAEALEIRLQNTPLEWRGPLVDVLDTYEICGMKLMAMQGFLVASDCIELTRLVLMQKIRTDAATAKEEAADEED